MYKKLKKYAQNKGLAVNEKAGLVYGRINGFFLVIKQDPRVPAHHMIQLGVKAVEGETAPALVDFLNQSTTQNQCLKNASYNGNKVVVEFEGMGRGWTKKYMPCMEAFLEELTAFCRKAGMVSCCETCGDEYGVSLYQIDGVPQTVCSACYGSMSEQLRQEINKKVGGKGSNIIGGLIGALLGSLIGVAVWVAIYQMGYLCAFAGAIMVICALKGYKSFGGKLDTKGVIISCIICIGMVWMSEQISLAIEIYKAYNDMFGVDFFEAFRAVPDFLTDSEVKSAVTYDLVMGYLLMILGAFGTVHQAIKESKGVIDTSMVTMVTGAKEQSGQWIQ